MRRPAQGRGAQRGDVRRLAGCFEAFEVAPERPEMGEQVVGEQYRLRPLEVRVAGQYEIPMRPGDLDERAHRLQQTVPYAPRGVPDEEAQVEGDLVVAAAARVQLQRHVADQLAQPPLYGRVYVLVRKRP